MILRKQGAGDSLWGSESDAVLYKLTQNYRGQTAGTFSEIPNDAPRKLIAFTLVHMRKKLRTMLARTERARLKAESRDK